MSISSVSCHRCPLYDPEKRACRSGKANPRRRLDAIAVAETLGPQTLCLLNPHREPYIQRMRYPKEHYIFSPRDNSHPPRSIEIELLDY